MDWCFAVIYTNCKLEDQVCNNDVVFWRIGDAAWHIDRRRGHELGTGPALKLTNIMIGTEFVQRREELIFAGQCWKWIVLH